MEVFTDKLVAKIPSTCSGVVKEVNFAVDDVCLVGHALLVIETTGDSSAASKDPDTNSEDEDKTMDDKPIKGHDHVDISKAPPAQQSGPGK